MYSCFGDTTLKWRDAISTSRLRLADAWGYRGERDFLVAPGATRRAVAAGLLRGVAGRVSGRKGRLLFGGRLPAPWRAAPVAATGDRQDHPRRIAGRLPRRGTGQATGRLRGHHRRLVRHDCPLRHHPGSLRLLAARLLRRQSLSTGLVHTQRFGRRGALAGGAGGDFFQRGDDRGLSVSQARAQTSGPAFSPLFDHLRALPVPARVPARGTAPLWPDHRLPVGRAGRGGVGRCLLRAPGTSGAAQLKDRRTKRAVLISWRWPETASSSGQPNFVAYATKFGLNLPWATHVPRLRCYNWRNSGRTPFASLCSRATLRDRLKRGFPA